MDIKQPKASCSANTWPGGQRHAMHQDAHERWNSAPYPGTRQLCSKCGETTGRCDEDAMWSNDGEPLCETCYSPNEKSSPTPSPTPSNSPQDAPEALGAATLLDCVEWKVVHGDDGVSFMAFPYNVRGETRYGWAIGPMDRRVAEWLFDAVKRKQANAKRSDDELNAPANKTKPNEAFATAPLLGRTPVITIACINENEEVVSQVSINTKYFNSNRPEILERALNRMVDEINKSSSSLTRKAFRVSSRYINNIYQADNVEPNEKSSPTPSPTPSSSQLDAPEALDAVHG